MKSKHTSIAEATAKVAKLQQDLEPIYNAMFNDHERHEKALTSLPQVAYDRFIQSGAMRSMAQLVLTDLTYRVEYLSLLKSPRNDDEKQKSIRTMNKQWQAESGLSPAQFCKYSQYKIDSLLPLAEDLVKLTVEKWTEYEALSTERPLTPQEILQQFKAQYFNSATSIVRVELTKDNWNNTLIKAIYTNKGALAEGGALRSFYGANKFKDLEVYFEFREPGSQLVLLGDKVQSAFYSNLRTVTKDDFLTAPDRTVEVTLGSQWLPDNCVAIIQDAHDQDVITFSEPSSQPPGILSVETTLEIMGKKVAKAYRPAIIDSNVGRSEIEVWISNAGRASLGGNSLIRAKLIVSTVSTTED